MGWRDELDKWVTPQRRAAVEAFMAEPWEPAEDEPVTDYKILVTGSRSWTDRETVAHAIGVAVGQSGARLDDVVIIHGCAAGADSIADRVARAYGYRTDPHPADWNGPCGPECEPGHRKWRNGETYCPAAGNCRNAEMIALEPDIVLAFINWCALPQCGRKKPHWSHGAAGCVRLARDAGIKVRECGKGEP